MASTISPSVAASRAFRTWGRWIDIVSTFPRRDTFNIGSGIGSLACGGHCVEPGNQRRDIFGLPKGCKRVPGITRGITQHRDTAIEELGASFRLGHWAAGV